MDSMGSIVLHDTVVMLYKLHRARGQQQQQCCLKILFNFVLNNNKANDDEDDDDEDVSVGGWLPTAATDG